MNSVKVKITFTPAQMKKMKAAEKKNEGLSIRLGSEQLLTSNGADTEVSHEQYKKMLSASKAKRGYIFKMTPAQIGGILPILAALFSALGPSLAAGAATGAATAAASYGTKKVLEKVFDKPKEGEGMTLPGNGLTLPGNGLTLPGHKRGTAVKKVVVKKKASKKKTTK
jgi:hypothetical protein